MLPDPVVTSLLVLRLNRCQLRDYLPAMSFDVRFVREGEELEWPAEAGMRTAFDVIEEALDIENDALRVVLSELHALIGAIVELTELGHDYQLFWIEKPYPERFDSLWAILNRLASEILKLGGLETRELDVSFTQFIAFGGFRTIRVIRHVES